MMMWNKMTFNFPSSSSMEMMTIFNDYMMMLTSSIMFLILMMMFYMTKKKYFNNKFLSNNQLEMIWTFIPMMIVLFIIMPSLKLLYFLDTCYFCGFPVKIIGHQWYWSYEINIKENLMFDSYMTKNSSLLRNLETDNSLVLPYSIPIRFMLTSMDVIHSWTIPSMGIKFDAIPGRTNQSCLMTNKVGLFFGQCSEICGPNHSFMPISVEVKIL